MKIGNNCVNLEQSYFVLIFERETRVWYYNKRPLGKSAILLNTVLGPYSDRYRITYSSNAYIAVEIQMLVRIHRKEYVGTYR